MLPVLQELAKLLTAMFAHNQSFVLLFYLTIYVCWVVKISNHHKQPSWMKMLTSKNTNTVFKQEDYGVTSPWKW